MPEILLPFKQYVVAEIEGVLRHLLDGGKLSEAPSAADESTLRRWWHEFGHKLEEWAGRLEARVFQVLRQIPGLLCDTNPLKRLETALSRLPALPSEWPTMVKTLWWLKKSHPL